MLNESLPPLRKTHTNDLKSFGLLANGDFAPPDIVASVGIGSRVRMVFTPISAEIALPQWMIDKEEQPSQVWRYPQE